MNTRTLLLLLNVTFMMLGCSDEDNSLDSSIPRLQSPSDNISYIRTKWRNGRHVETTFFDNQNRILEKFCFGRSSTKSLNQYQGSRVVTSIYYEHSDSSEPGYIDIDTLRQEFDAAGRLIKDAHFRGSLSKSSRATSTGFVKRHMRYTADGDTIITRTEYSHEPPPYQPTANISSWDHDEKHRIVHYYRLLVSGTPPDTLHHFSQRFTYDSIGRLKMAWFENMYLGRFYYPAGPDTIRYHYDSQNRLIQEDHRFTTNMQNKRAFDVSKLSTSEKQSMDFYKKKFFEGNEYSASSNRTDVIKYRYEKFDLERHRKLEIPEPY